jgi:hypothetical protein
MNISAERDMHIHAGNFYSVGRDMTTQILPNSFGATQLSISSMKAELSAIPLL